MAFGGRFATSEQGLQYAHELDRFSAACDQAGMKINTKKTKVLRYVSSVTQDSAARSYGKCTPAGRDPTYVGRGGIHKWRKTEQVNEYTGW